jgi:hypothetical protein
MAAYIKSNRDIWQVPRFMPRPLGAFIKQKIPFHINLQIYIWFFFLKGFNTFKKLHVLSAG